MGIPKEAFIIQNQILKEHIRLSRLQSQYDHYSKKLLSNKYILAWILKNTTEEFHMLEIPYIAHHCIEGNPLVSEIPVPYTNTVMNENIIGSNTEDKIPGEGSIYYDIRFEAIVPGSREPVRLHLNVEAQKDYPDKYDIVTRGIFYGARMLSAQHGTEFTPPAYNHIKKVYSIWICMNVPQYIGNSIAIWHIVQDNLHGIVPVKKEAYDLLSVVCVCLNDKMQTENSLIRLLNTLLSPTLKAEEKIRILTQDFHIFMEKQEKKEVNQMCNLSEAIVEEGIRQGLSQGITQGITQGIAQGITQGIAQGIHAFIRCCFDSGNQEEEILEKLKKYFSLDDASASEALQRFLSGNLAKSNTPQQADGASI